MIDSLKEKPRHLDRAQELRAIFEQKMQLLARMKALRAEAGALNALNELSIALTGKSAPTYGELDEMDYLDKSDIRVLLDIYHAGRRAPSICVESASFDPAPKPKASSASRRKPERAAPAEKTPANKPVPPSGRNDASEPLDANEHSEHRLHVPANSGIRCGNLK